MFKTAARAIFDALEESELSPDVQEIVRENMPNDDHAPLGDENPGRLYLERITAEGFRGIGPRSEIAFQPTNGLTVVVGGNGTGKSSLAEAAERLLTGTTVRWQSSATDAKVQWRNVHHEGDPSVGMSAYQEGSSLPIDFALAWDSGDDFEAGSQTVTLGGLSIKQEYLQRLQLSIESYPPLLPYAELDAVLTGKPSDLFDAFNRILGLSDLDDSRAEVSSEAYKLGQTLEASRLTRVDAVEACSATDHEHAAALSELIESATDLRVVEEYLDGMTANPGGPQVAAILRISLLETDQLTAQVERMGQLELQLAEDDHERRTEILAELLERAVQVLDAADAEEIQCPVCGEGTLSSEWRTHAREEMARCRSESETRRNLKGELEACRRSVLDALAPLVGLGSTDEIPSLVGLERKARASVDSVTNFRDVKQTTDQLLAVVDLQRRCREEADKSQAASKELLAPVVDNCRKWIAAERNAVGAARRKADLESARDWMSEEIGVLRDQRMAALSAQAMNIWEKLSPGSDIQMSPLQLLGSKGRRRLELACETEGKEAKARSILSQGELHALALSIFVPRAVYPGSPFGFLVIDDPIHALDDIKIDGLAEVLHEVAKGRQVIVFTHDSRLETALDMLGLRSEIIRLERSRSSTVLARLDRNDVSNRLKDARDLAKDPKIDDSIKLAVVAGCCRTAVEEAAIRHYRRSARAEGHSMDEIDSRLDGAGTMWDRVSIALFDTTERGAAQRVERSYSKETRDLLGVLSSAGHEIPSGIRPGQLPERTKSVIDALFPGMAP